MPNNFGCQQEAAFELLYARVCLSEEGLKQSAGQKSHRLLPETVPTDCVALGGALLWRGQNNYATNAFWAARRSFSLVLFLFHPKKDEPFEQAQNKKSTTTHQTSSLSSSLVVCRPPFLFSNCLGQAEKCCPKMEQHFSLVGQLANN